MRIYKGAEASLTPIVSKKIAVIGYGSQGSAHALNLKESGCDVCVGLRDNSPSIEKARSAGLNVSEISKSVIGADIIMLLVPDEEQGDLYQKSIKPYLCKGKTLMFAHGFSILFKQIEPPLDVDVVMVAPKGAGYMVRSEYQKGSGVPCLAAIHQDTTGKAMETALAYANGIGGARAFIIETTFKIEAETDLFGEQSVLCGGIVSLMTAGFETLTGAGYPPEMAFFECIHEVKIIVDLIYQNGFSKMNQAISNTAEYGGYKTGGFLIDGSVKVRMKEVLRKIQSGEFAKEWVAENKAGKPFMTAERENRANHPVEKIGQELRALMPWLNPDNK